LTEWNSKTYKNHYRIGGMKLTLDGSPQGRTAWRTLPYLLPPDGAGKDYLGYPATLMMLTLRQSMKQLSKQLANTNPC
jgi:predicted amidohydrolase YtcJ